MPDLGWNGARQRMIDGLSLKFFRVLSSDILRPEITDSARKFILDQILNSEVVDIFDNAQLKLGDKTILANLSKLLSQQKLFVGQSLEGEVTRVLPDGKAQIRLEGHTVVADFKQALAPGQKVKGTVEQLTPLPVIRLLDLPKISGDDRATLNKNSINQVVKGNAGALAGNIFESGGSLTESDIQLLNLSQGKPIHAHVSAVIDKETVLIQYNETQFGIRGLKDVLPGDSLVMKAETVAGQSRLIVTSEASESETLDINSIKSYLSSKQPLGEMVAKLEELLGGNSLLTELGSDPKLLKNLKDTLNILRSDSSTPDANAIKKQIEISGLNYEAKVAQALVGKAESEIPSCKAELAKDLKGQLLSLAKEIEGSTIDSVASSLSSKQNPKLADVLQYVKQAIDNIELNQLSNHFAKQEGNPILVQIPYPLAPEKSISLYIKKQPGRGKGDPEDKQNLNMVFLLDMTALGSLRVDTQINNDQLSIKFGADSQSVVDFIHENSISLKAQLKDMGYKAEVSCSKQKKEEMQIDDGISRLFTQDTARLVDIKT